MADTGKKTILLVEDEALIAMAKKMDLEKYGYVVIAMNTGEKAIEAIEDTPGIDLILMDIDLGKGIDGTEIAERILRYHDIPVIFLSSHTEQDIVEKTEKITSYGYVVKDSSITVLDASIKMAFKLFEAKTSAAQAAEQFRAIVENTADCIMRYDRKCRQLYGNPSAFAASGLTPEQSGGKRLRDLDLPEELCLQQEDAIESVFRTGVSRTIEFEADLVYGHAFLQLQFSPEFNAKGSVNSVIGVSRDISDLKRTEENLSAHQIQLQMQNVELRGKQEELETLRLLYFDLYDMAPACCFTLSKNGMILEANLTAAELFGTTRNGLLQQPFTAFIQVAELDVYYHHRKVLFETGVVQYCDLQMRRQDDTGFYAYLKAVKGQDEAGAPICRVAVMEHEGKKPAESRQGEH